jgi:carbon storage regulator
MEDVMLVLSRRIGDRITIGYDVQITITRIAGGRVAIGIDAPTTVAIRRNEIAPHVPIAPSTMETADVVEELVGLVRNVLTSAG